MISGAVSRGAHKENFKQALDAVLFVGAQRADSRFTDVMLVGT